MIVQQTLGGYFEFSNFAWYSSNGRPCNNADNLRGNHPVKVLKIHLHLQKFWSKVKFLVFWDTVYNTATLQHISLRQRTSFIRQILVLWEANPYWKTLFYNGIFSSLVRLECRSVSYAFLFPISSRFPTTGFSILHSAQINTSRRHERDEHVRAIALMMVKMIAGLIADNKASPLQCVLINTVDPYAAISLSAPAIANSNYLFSIAIPSPFVLPFFCLANSPLFGCRRWVPSQRHRCRVSLSFHGLSPRPPRHAMITTTISVD